MPPDPATATPADHDSWGTLRRFLPYLWPKGDWSLKRRIIGAFVFVLLAKATILALPFAYKGAVDRMTTPDNEAFLLTMALVVVYALGRFTSVAFDNLRNITFERVGQDATRQLAEDVFHRLHRLSLRFHLSRRTGEVTKVIERGTKSIDSMLYFLLFNIAPTIIELIAVMLNYETVKYFGAESREEERYARATDAYAKAALKSENSLGFLNITQAFITNALMAGAMAFTVWGWSTGRFTVGDLVLVNTYLMQLFRPLDMLGWVYRTIRQGLVDMGNMFKLIDTEVEVKDRIGAPALVVRRPTVAFDDVIFGYEKERTILHGLSFEVPAGDNIAIVGPSGAGKSTIARLLFRFYDPWSGRILIDGQDIAAVTQASVREAIGIVPQDSVLFNDTIGYNIAYGRGGADRDTVLKAAQDAAILPFITRQPDGFDTMVGERGLKLSGGEKQRVAIARTLVKDPPILMLDEATSALDTRTEQDILETLDRISRDRTTLSIAHRLSTIADADEILVLDQGKLAERGRHGALLKRDGLYAEMWFRQASDMEAAV